MNSQAVLMTLLTNIGAASEKMKMGFMCKVTTSTATAPMGQVKGNVSGEISNLNC